MGDPVVEVVEAREAAVPRPTPLEECVADFRRWLFLPDEAPLLAVLGAVAANRLDGDPVWLLLVGPSGGGKSEILVACTTLDDVHPAATLTEASLLSATPARERADGAKGGLLRVIGDRGILLFKDFTSVLSMERGERGRVLAALREVYDGSWTRHVGVDGGRTFHWSGRIGLVAGCTPTIDRHHGVIGAMGERFVLFRLPPADAEEQARGAVAHTGREIAMRAELAAAVRALFDAQLAKPRDLDAAELERLVNLATLVARARSAVERDGHTREIELIPEPEAPTRLAIVLRRLLDGLDAIGVDRATAWEVVGRCALDSMPAIRRALLRLLIEEHEPVNTSTLAEQLGYPTGTTRRALEDLVAHRLVIRHSGGEGKADLWVASDETRTRYAATSRDWSP